MLTQADIELTHDRKIVRETLSQFLQVQLKDEVNQFVHLLSDKPYQRMAYREFAFAVVTEVMLLKRSTTSITAVIGAGLTHLRDIRKDAAERLSLASDLIFEMAKADLIDMIPPHLSVSGDLEVGKAFELVGDIASIVSQVHYLPPLIEAPKAVWGMEDSAYHVAKVSVVSRDTIDVGQDMAWDALNLSNKVEFSLDMEFLELVEEQVNPDAPWLKQQTPQVVGLLENTGNKFHFSHFYDYRGRVYVRGYHLNYQGDSYRKAMVNFAKAESIYIDDKYANIF